MRLATYHGEEDINALVLWLYQIPAGHTAATNHVKGKIRKANPHVDFDNLARLPFGSLLLVPDVPGIEQGDKSSPIPHGGAALLVKMRLVLNGIRRAATLSVDCDVARAKQTLQHLEEARGRAKKSPKAGKRLTELAGAANDQIKNAELLKAARQQALNQLERRLDQNIKRLLEL